MHAACGEWISLTRSIKQTFPVHQYFDPTLSPWWRIMMPVSQLLHIGNNVTFEIDSVILKELFSNEYWLKKIFLFTIILTLDKYLQIYT